MAGPKITAELLLSTDMKDVVREIDKGLSGAMRQHAKEVKKTIGGAWRDAVELALGDGRSGRALKDFLQAGVVDAAEQYTALMKQGRVAEAQAQKELLDQRAKAFKREIDLRRRAFAEMQDRQLETAEEAADRYKGGAEKMASILRGDVGGLLDMARGGGRGVASRGRAMQDRASQIQAAGGDPKQAAQMAKIGGAMAKVGMALGAIAAAVGIVVVLVKMFGDLEEKIKDMNKTLLEGAGAADFGFTRMDFAGGKFSKRLDEIRKQTTAVNDNYMRFRVGAQEQQQILAQMNQAGLTFRKMDEEISKGASHMKSYSDVTALAITYSRNLGVSTGEISEKMGDFTLDTGMGLQDIAEQFSIIQREAMAAGFVTKRFYAAIVESTSGMAFYGVRIEETTKLLKSFDSLLGETSGTEVFKKIAREGGKSFQDTLKEFLIKDPKFAAEQYGKVFEQRIAMLERQFAGKLPQGVSVRGMIEETGGGTALAERLEELGITGQRGTDIMQAAELMKAATGEMAAMMGARGAAGPAFEAVMKLRQMPGLGGESMGEVYEKAVKDGNEGMLVALQELSQSMGKDFDELKVLDQKNFARLKLLQKIAKEGGEVPKHLQDLGFFIERLPDGTAKVMKGIVEKGGIVNKETAREMGDRWDMLLVEPTEDGKRLKEQLTKDQQIASDISHTLTGLNDIMSQSILTVLNAIYDGVMSVYEWLVRDDTARLADAAQQRTARAQLTALKNQEETLREEIQNLTVEQEMATQEGDTARATQLQGEIDKKQAEIVGALQASGAITAAQAKREGMTVEERLASRGGEGLGFAEGKIGATRAKDVGAVVDEIVGDRLFQDTLFAGDIQAMGGQLGEALGIKDTLAERTMAKFGETGLAEKLGREDLEMAVERAAAEGKKAADELGWFAGSDEELQAEEEAFRAALKTELVPLFTQAANLERIANSTEETASAAQTGVALDLVGADRAKDLILPASGGSPIITDERDTLFAARPGGPLAGAMGGGGGGGGGRGSVQVNVYGGDQRKVYETVMRALKATGNA